MSHTIEIITLWRGKDSATYLASEFAEKGEDATPLWVRQNPTDDKPWHKIKLVDTDAIATETITTKIAEPSGSWDINALRLLRENKK